MVRPIALCRFSFTPVIRRVIEFAWARASHELSPILRVHTFVRENRRKEKAEPQAQGFHTS